MQTPTRRRAFGRTRRTAAVVGCAVLLTLVVTDTGAAAPDTSPTQTEPFNAGRGTAIALAYTVNPTFGNLSFGITAGESVAGHQNTAAQAQSKAVNLGVIGLSLAGEGCEGKDPTWPEEDQPHPVVVSSDDPGADKGKSASEANGGITMFARATKDPFAEAITKVAPVGEPTLAVVTGGTSIASSGVVAPGVREARAITKISELRLLGGQVILGDMRWEAVQRTGADTVNEGTFTVGTLTIAGTEVPLPSESADQLKAVTDALRDVAGLQIAMPEIRTEKGVVFVEPMKIGIVPNDTRDTLLGGILTDLQDAREKFADFLLSIGCGGDPDLLGGNSGTILTLFDLALATGTGAGSTNLEIGGVQATTAEITRFQGLGEFTPPALPPVPPPPPPALDAPADLGSAPGVAAPPVAGSPDTGDSSPEVSTPTTPISAFKGERGGALLLVGGGGLLALLAAAEADRRKMRHAQLAATVTS